jgi:hypothetical protein
MGFDDTWADAVPRTDENSNGNPPPNGTYDVALIDASAFTSKAGDDYVKFEWQTVDKQHAWPQLNGFGTVKAAGFTKGQCMKVGVDVELVSAFAHIDDALKPLIGQFYEVKVEHNGEYVNTYVLDGQGAPMGADVPADNSSTPASTDNDPVPF